MKKLFGEIRQHHFLKTVMGPESVVVDLGANEGEFSRQLTASCGCRCLAVEADPKLIAAYAPHPSIRYFHYAFGATLHPQRLHLCARTEANSVFPNVFHGEGSVEVPGMTLERFMADQGLEWIDLIKMDIEGSEIAVFDSTRDDTLRRIGQMTIEFHDFVINTNFLPAVRRIKRRLKELGFVCLIFSRPHNHSDVLLINRRHPVINAKTWRGIWLTNLCYLRARHYYKHTRQFVKGVLDYDVCRQCW